METAEPRRVAYKQFTGRSSESIPNPGLRHSLQALRHRLLLPRVLAGLYLLGTESLYTGYSSIASHRNHLRWTQSKAEEEE